jgi:hypothetical protein
VSKIHATIAVAVAILLLAAPGSAVASASKAVPHGYYACEVVPQIRNQRADAWVVSVLRPGRFSQGYQNSRDETYCFDVSQVLEYWLVEPWTRETAQAEASYWESLPESVQGSAIPPTVPPGVRPPTTIPSSFHLDYPAGSRLYLGDRSLEEENTGRVLPRWRSLTPTDLASFAFSCRRFYGRLWSCVHNRRYAFIFELTAYQEAPQEFWHGGPPLPGGVRFERQGCSESKLVPAVTGACPRE